MPFSGIANPEQMTMLTTVLDDHCRDNGIDPSSPEREDAALLILSLFSSGAHSIEELKAALERASGRW